jgi:anti-sigma-K factor RskA
MSDTDHFTPHEEVSLVAAEYVLGVLGAHERAAVERVLARDANMAREVAFWEERLGAMADEVAPVAPPEAMLALIETAVFGRPEASPNARPAAVVQRQRAGLWRSLAFWRGLAFVSAALAAASLAALAYLGPLRLLPSTGSRQPLLATLGQTSGQPGFVAAIGGGGRELVIVPASLLAADQRSMELWLIPAGDKPHSLGLIAPGAPVRLTLPPDLVGRVNTDAALAVSLEPPGGSPTGQPTGPVIASGKLTSL